MAGDTKNARSERDPQSLVADLLRRATSPEVLAGVAGAAAAARFTKHLVEDSNAETEETQAEKPLESDGTDESAENEPVDEERDEPSPEEDEIDDDEPEEPRAGNESDEDEEDEPDEDEEDEPDEDGRDEPGAKDEEEPEEDDRHEPSATEEQKLEAGADPEPAEGDETEPEQDEGTDEGEAASDSSANGSGTEGERMELLDKARRYAEQLTGHPVESFSSLERDDRGWRIGMEVVELSRVPSTTDVLGSYELVLTDEGEFVDFRRGHRYSRNSTDDVS